MYAKLVFPKGTDFNLVCRDIVRTIVNSDGAGGSTVGALENVDAGNSTITDTVASNWALAAGQTIPTGAVVAQDVGYYLQQAHANGTTKTCFVGSSFSDTTKAADTLYAGTVLFAVSDYGETYEQIWNRASSASSPSTNLAHRCRVTGEEVHIVAKDKLLLIYGQNSGYIPGRGYTCLVEPVDTYETRASGNRPSYVLHHGNDTLNDPYSGFSSTSETSGLRDHTSTNPFSATYPTNHSLSLVNLITNPTSTEHYRCIHVSPKSYTAVFSDPGNSDPDTLWAYYGLVEDLGQADGNGTYHYATTSGDLEPILFGGSGTSWAYGTGPYSSMLHGPRRNLSQNVFDPRDTAGTPAVFFEPQVDHFGLYGYAQDYTSEAGLYAATPNFDGATTTLNDGSSDYFCFKTRTGSGFGWGLAVRLD